jgi:hypothetical protein
MTDRLFEYALGQLNEQEAREVLAYLADHPEAGVMVAKLQAILRPLEADRAQPEPPPGLATDTIAALAQELVITGEIETIRYPRRQSWGDWLLDRQKINILVACCLALVVFAMLMTGVTRLRDHQTRMACQDQLRATHLALTGYADTHSGRYPEVGTEAVPQAGDFVKDLVRSGQLPIRDTASCPLNHDTPYTYTLGFRATPQSPVAGLRVGESRNTTDWTPVAADLPTATNGPICVHAGGQNVLFVNGSVRFATTRQAGLQGDDIYCNDAGIIRAGLSTTDASLGRSHDQP